MQLFKPEDLTCSVHRFIQDLIGWAHIDFGVVQVSGINVLFNVW